MKGQGQTVIKCAAADAGVELLADTTAQVSSHRPVTLNNAVHIKNGNDSDVFSCDLNKRTLFDFNNEQFSRQCENTRRAEQINRLLLHCNAAPGFIVLSIC